MSLVSMLLPPMGLIDAFIQIAIWRLDKPLDAMRYDLAIIEKKYTELCFIVRPVYP